MQRQDFDVVIIGAGPAGLTSARAALAKGKRVLILDLNSESDSVNHSVFLKPKRNVASLGGAARAWGGQVCLANKDDLDPWIDQMRYTPQEIQLLINEQTEIARKMNIPFQELIYNNSISINSKEYKLNLRKTVIVQPVDILHYFQDVLSSPNIEYLSNVNVENLIIRQGKVSLVRAKVSQGNKVELLEVVTESKIVTLAAGCISSTEILLKSLEKQKIERNFQSGIVTDHPNGTFIDFKSRKFKNIIQISSSKNIKVKYELIFNANNKFYKAIFEVREKYPSMGIKEGLLKPIRSRKNINENLKFKFASLPVIKKFSLKTYQIWIQIEQSLNSDNLFYLEKGALKSKYDYRKEDFVIFDFAIKSIKDILKNENITITQEIEPNGHNIVEAYHPSGSLLGSDFDASYGIGKFGEVNSIDNLIISSSGSFPTQSWINPTLLIMAFAKISTERKLNYIEPFREKTFE